MKVRELIAVIQADEWSEVRTKGSHRQFRHPTKPGTVTVAGSPASMCRSVGSVHPQDAESPLPIPADLREQVEHAERMGFDLYIFDKAAWIATDVLQEHVGNLQNAGIGGYLPLREGDDEGRVKDSFLVWFFSKDDPTKLAYRVRVFARLGR